MRYVTTRHQAPPASFETALFDGMAPDGGLYVPETIERWSDSELARLPRRTLTEIALRALRPFTRGEVDPATLEAVVVEALNFAIPLVEIEPDIFALELFHGPTLAFKDVGARVMARLMAVLHRAEEPLTVLVATSGDTGSAVAAVDDAPAPPALVVLLVAFVGAVFGGDAEPVPVAARAPASLLSALANVFSASATFCCAPSSAA